ncbi:MAG: ribbon-helix-helix domain-containing protein, partial [Acidilobus sp.]
QLREASMALGITRSKLVRIALNYAFQIGVEHCSYEPAFVDARFNFTLTSELYQKLNELAERLGTSKAVIIRSALTCFLLVLKPYMGKYVEVNGVKVPAWVVEVLSMIAAAEGKSTDELIVRAIVNYARKYAKRLRLNIAVLNKALSAQGSQS